MNNYSQNLNNAERQNQTENEVREQVRKELNQIVRQIPPRCYQNHIQREHHQEVVDQ